MNRVIAYLDNKKVEVSMLRSDKRLTVYNYIDNKTCDMTVICHIPKQDYEIDENSGLIELNKDKKEWLCSEKLKIKPILFDEITNGEWD